MNRLTVIAAVILSVFSTSGSAFAHEPIFGLGPHTIFKGGVGLEMEFEGEKASGAGKVEREHVLTSEIIYGFTVNLSGTLSIPYILERSSINQSSGPGDVSLRTKYRFWRRDGVGVQDSAAVVTGVKLPTGDDGKTPRLGSGSTDYLFALTVARESLKWYYFGDARYRLNTEGGGGLRAGNVVFADFAIGIRPRKTKYLRPDLVLIAELNFESRDRNELFGVDVADSGGTRLFLSPSFFYTYRNWALKGGIQLPIDQDLNGNQLESDYRYSLAVESHI